MSHPLLQPGRFKERAARALNNPRQRGALRRATALSLAKREAVRQTYPEWEQLRQRLHQIKTEALDNLPALLRQFEQAVVERGGHVHWAETAADARGTIAAIAAQHGISLIVKAKSMATEEIELRDDLIAQGIEVVETDLGEYIIQLAGEIPSHLTAPVLHKTRQEIGALFAEKLGIPYSEDPVGLSLTARRVLREKFITAGMGISGANFALADKGAVVLVENEGNIRLTASAPRVLVSVVGLEKVIPRMQDLAPFLKLLPASATGQRASAYVSIISGPRRAGEADGPDEWHVVLLDNGRWRLLGDPHLREALMCIKCGACLNICPVYQKVGGHTYGSVYPGPIGAVLTPAFNGLVQARWLPFASTLCGACSEICPVGINIHHMLLHLRARIVEAGGTALAEKGAMAAFRAMRFPALYEMGARIARNAPRLLGRRLERAALRAWTDSREWPGLAPRSFHQLWSALEQQQKDGRQ